MCSRSEHDFLFFNMSSIKASLCAPDNDLGVWGETKDWTVEGLAPGAETFPS